MMRSLPYSGAYQACSGPNRVVAVFERCVRAGVRMCVLRDADGIENLTGGEIDVLIDPRHFDLARAAFRAEGFVELRAHGHAPHRFFVHYDGESDRWIKCDVVTAIRFGDADHSQRTALADACLDRRVQAGRICRLSPEDELFTLLLHELLDKHTMRPRRMARLKELCAAVSDGARIDAHLRRYWPDMTWPQLAERIERDEWRELVTRSEELRRRLCRADHWQIIARRIARLCGRAAGFINPQAPSVSFLAPDGAGKSTAIVAVAQHFFGGASTIYMGLYQKNATAKPRLPGTRFAAAILLQWRRYIRARGRQACGHLVLFDRYTYDAWLPTRRRTWWTAVRRALLAHVCPAPDLSVVLDAPAAVLYARKQEHSLPTLEAHRQCYRAMQQRVPRLVVVDATGSPEDVRRAIMSLVWDRYRRGRRAPIVAAAGKG